MTLSALDTATVIDFTKVKTDRLPISRRSPAAPINILLVEDDDSDIMLTQAALDAANIEYELHTLQNGAEVLPYLRAQHQYHDEPKPTLLMLDLSIPGKDGFEVLEELAATPERYRHLPIVILTGDRHSGFLKYSCDLRIVAYLTKPCSAEKMQRTIGALGKRWG